jgi:hypothetical protein
MKSALCLLLLAVEGNLAQSMEPSQWDHLLPSYGDANLFGSCTCTGGSSCNTANAVTVEQTSSISVTATYATGVPALRLAYLTDQDGTVIAYKSSDELAGTTSSISFTWATSEAPTEVVPHIVYDSTCADVFPSVKTSTWLNKLALMYQEYDVGNQGGVANLSSTEVLSASASITLDDLPTTWFSGADVVVNETAVRIGEGDSGKFKATFPLGTDPMGIDGMNAAWVKNQDGTILAFEEIRTADKLDLEGSFPRGTTELTACRLFTKRLLCASTRLDYFANIEALTTTDKGTYSAAGSSFSAVFSGTYNAASGMTSIGPKSGTCARYVLYAKTADGSEVLGFSFDQALHFVVPASKTYKVYLTCDGASLSTGTMDVTKLKAKQCGGADCTFNMNYEVQVGEGSLMCVTTLNNKSTEHANDQNKTFDYDGRRCYCTKGSLFCEKRDAKDVVGGMFLLNEAESVGVALSVSVIVLLLLCCIIYLLWKWKSAKSSEQVVLKDNAEATTLGGGDDRL